MLFTHSIPSIGLARPEALVRAMAVAGAIDVKALSVPQLRWIESQTEPNETQDFWIPYSEYRGMIYMKPWALSIINFLTAKGMSQSAIQSLNPESFYDGIVPRVAAADSNAIFTPWAEQAYSLATVEGARSAGYDDWADQLEILYARVRNAAAQGKLVTNSRRIKRVMQS